MRAKNRRAVIVFDLAETVDVEQAVSQLAARLLNEEIAGSHPDELHIVKLRKITFAGETFQIEE